MADNSPPVPTPRKKRKVSKGAEAAGKHSEAPKGTPESRSVKPRAGAATGLPEQSPRGDSFRVPADFTAVTAPCSLACSNLSEDQELWLLQLPLSWQEQGSVTVSATQDAAGSELWLCQDGSGSHFRLLQEDNSIANQVWGITPRPGHSTPVQVTRRVTMVASAHKPLLPDESQQCTLSLSDVAAQPSNSPAPKVKHEKLAAAGSPAVNQEAATAKMLHPEPKQSLKGEKGKKEKKDKKSKHKHKHKQQHVAEAD